MFRYYKLCLLMATLYIINLDVSNAYSSGPPSSVCNSMVPGAPSHAVPSGIGALPYTLTVNGGSTTYASGETITLTLTGTPQFKGFFIQARRVDSTSTRVGSWTATSGQSTASCSPTQSISHNSGSLKSSETVTFTAPDATTAGNIQFYFTVVQERIPTSIYWAFQPGPALAATIPTTSTTSTPASTSTTAGTMATITAQTSMSTGITISTTVQMTVSGVSPTFNTTVQTTASTSASQGATNPLTTTNSQSTALSSTTQTPTSAGSMPRYSLISIIIYFMIVLISMLNF